VEPSTVRKSLRASKNALRVVNGRQDSGPVRTRSPPSLGSRTDGSPLQRSAMLHSPVSSIKYVVSLRGTGCLCFFECAFPGCIGHHVPPSTTTKEVSSLRPRSDGWAHCVDRSGCVALPEPEQVLRQPPFRGALETFLSRGTSLPPLMKDRPTNVTIFPAGLFSADFGGMSDSFGGDGGRREKPRSAWCLVDASEPERRESVCGCPDGRRGCETCYAGWKEVFLPVPLAVVR